MMASSTFFITLSDSLVILGVLSRFLSIVRICDKFTIESFLNPFPFLMVTHMGYDAFFSDYSVIIATMVVGEYMFPMSF